jgi:hypothetical protein
MVTPIIHGGTVCTIFKVWYRLGVLLKEPQSVIFRVFFALQQSGCECKTRNGVTTAMVEFQRRKENNVSTTTKTGHGQG